MPRSKKAQPPASLSLDKLDAGLRRWRKRYNTQEKVAAAHQKVLLDRVVQSMAFEGQPVSKVRLKALLKARKKISPA